MSSSSRQSYRLTARDFTSSSTRHRCKSTSVSSATRQLRAYLSFKGRSAFKNLPIVGVRPALGRAGRVRTRSWGSGGRGT